MSNVYYIIESTAAVSFFAAFFDLILPPRATEALVRGLTLRELQDLLTPAGLLPYHDPRVTALVWEVKYHANKRAAALAGEMLCEPLLAVAAEELGRPLLVPIPMHAARRKERGHNQTELLCEAALRHVGNAFEYAPAALIRTAATPPQQGLERTKRLQNVRGSMRAGDHALVARRVCVVVDDVTTTGATLAEARRALLKAGAARVHLVALAQS